MTAPTLWQATQKDVGGIPVARLLPQAKKRTIGAWCFLDHAGPARFDAGNPGLQVGNHPHTHLQTFTWMLSGEVRHKDSLGNDCLIRPGQVNLMTAGEGIAHTEQTPAHSHELHAVQLWIALPKEQTIPASFHHYPDLPSWENDGVRFVLTTGEFAGQRAPTLQYSPIVGVDAQMLVAGSHTLVLNPAFEYGILALRGEALQVNGENLAVNQLMYLPCGETRVTLTSEDSAHLMLIGGEPLDFDPVIWWNFVAPDRQGIKQAVADWNAHSPRFGEIETELSRLVAPEVPWKENS